MESKKVSEIKPYSKNAKKHPKEQVDKIARSIEEFGFNQPIVIDKDNIIIVGHGRFQAAKKLGLKEVPILIKENLSKEQVNAYRLADNKIAESEWDMELVIEELKELELQEFDVSLTGFEIELLEDDPKIEEDEAPQVPTQAITILGDLYELNGHRLHCADSTDVQAVEKLMDGKKADMVFTDPPYGINEETDRKFASLTRLAEGNTFEKIKGDENTDVAIASINLCKTLDIDTQIFWGGNYYDLPPSPCWIVWDKRVEEKQTDMNSDCELAYVFHKDKKSVRIFRHLWKGMIKESEQGVARCHPTQKPIALAVWCFDNYGEPKSVLDLFLGSGSTLIACEQTNRICYGQELDEKYCDVIVKRWINYMEKEGKDFEIKRNGEIIDPNIFKDGEE